VLFSGVIRLVRELAVKYINARGVEYASYSKASASGDERIVKLLLENDADVNTRPGEFGNALQVAMWLATTTSSDCCSSTGRYHWPICKEAQIVGYGGIRRGRSL
jgi:hypothetical protein